MEKLEVKYYDDLIKLVPKLGPHGHFTSPHTFGEDFDRKELVNLVVNVQNKINEIIEKLNREE